MSDARDTDEIAGDEVRERPGIIRQPHLPFDVATPKALDMDAYIAEAKQLKAEGFYDIETYRKRSAASRPAS